MEASKLVSTAEGGATDRISGRTALVTGAGNGLGRAIASELASAGARVILTGRDQAKLEAVARQIGNSQRVATVDTSSEESVTALAAVLADEDVSILVNNAGVAGPVAALTDIDLDDWDRVFAVNVRGIFLMGEFQRTSQHWVLFGGR